MSLHAHMHAHAHTLTHAHVCTHMCTLMHMHTHNALTHVNTLPHMYSLMHTYSHPMCPQIQQQAIGVDVHACGLPVLGNSVDSEWTVETTFKSLSSSGF